MNVAYGNANQSIEKMDNLVTTTSKWSAPKEASMATKHYLISRLMEPVEPPTRRSRNAPVVHQALRGG